MRISDGSSDVCSSDLRAYSIAPALKRSLSLSLAEQRRSDPHMGGAKPDGCLEIAGHAHRQPIEPVFADKLGEQRKERRWLYFRRGDRSEERRVGNKGVGTGNTRGPPHHTNKTT